MELPNEIAGIAVSYELTSGEQAPARLHHLRQEQPHTGFYPLLLGDQEDAQTLLNDLECSVADFQQTLLQADQLDPAAWTAQQWQAEVDALAAYSEDAGFLAVDPSAVQPSPARLSRVRGGIPAAYAQLTALYENRSGRPREQLVLAKIALDESWQIPALLQYGGWNACPQTAEHVALLHYWQRACGAQLASVQFDVLELVVQRPPQNVASAIALAKEQYAYCSDIVTQGTGSLMNLASALLGAENWFFWWD